jgi:hypothetical protein
VRGEEAFELTLVDGVSEITHEQFCVIHNIECLAVCGRRGFMSIGRRVFGWVFGC